MTKTGRTRILQTRFIQRKRYLDHYAVTLLIHRQAAAGEDPEHGLISREHIGFEPRHVVLPPDLDEMPKDPAGNAKTLTRIVEMEPASLFRP